MSALKELEEFQSTLPRGERQRRWNLTLSATDFNPRSREGSDPEQNYLCWMPMISIHAPARGATLSFDRCYSQNDISIHAPARGATRGNGRVRADHENFNPRSREGSDGILAASWQTWKISIHAPARGATRSRMASFWHFCYFNPRSREGSDCNFI